MIHTAQINPTKTYKTELLSTVNIPLLGRRIRAGFPSAADDYIEHSIDLNKAFIKNKATTFMMEVEGNSMKDVGIIHKGYVLVDKSIEVRDNHIVVCGINDEFTVKRIKIEKDIIWLLPENKDYKPIKVTKEDNLIIWGVVIGAFKSFDDVCFSRL